MTKDEIAAGIKCMKAWKRELKGRLKAHERLHESPEGAENIKKNIEFTDRTLEWLKGGCKTDGYSQ